MEIEPADSIIRIDRIPWDKNLFFGIIESDASRGMPRNVQDFPFCISKVQGFSPLEFTIYLELECPGLIPYWAWHMLSNMSIP